MDKNTIKNKVRESLLATEAENEETKKKDGNEKKKKKDVASIQRALNNNSLLTKSQVMKAAGLGDPDDATARSLFNKKVNQDKNEEGATYNFSDEELARVAKVVSNPTAYIGKQGSSTK